MKITYCSYPVYYIISQTVISAVNTPCNRIRICVSVYFIVVATTSSAPAPYKSILRQRVDRTKTTGNKITFLNNSSSLFLRVRITCCHRISQVFSEMTLKPLKRTKLRTTEVSTFFGQLGVELHGSAFPGLTACTVCSLDRTQYIISPA